MNKLHKASPLIGAFLAMFGMATWIGKTPMLMWYSHYTIGLLFISSVLILLSTMTLLLLVLIKESSFTPRVIAYQFASLAVGIVITSAATFYLFVDNGILASRIFWVGAIAFLSLNLGFSLVFLTKQLDKSK